MRPSPICALTVLISIAGCSSDPDALNAHRPGDGSADSAVDAVDSATPGTSPADGSLRDGSARDAALAPPSLPKMGEPGCGFAAAAFCDTFDRPSSARGRAGELDPAFWSGARMMGQLSTTRAMGIGMAVIPDCRTGVPNHVWPDDDTLICDPTADVASNHLLVAVAAQNYGQNGYRIRQPFDFAGRTGQVTFDAAVDPLSPLRGWVSFAITEDPIALPGYSIQGNDEGSIIPRNAIEAHFVNAPGSTGDEMALRNVHVFRNYVDTVYAPDELPRVSYRRGKLNRYVFSVSERGVEVSVTPFSQDGRSFAAPAFRYHVDADVPFTRGYVHLSVHNHATLKYTNPGDGFAEVVDASVALIDNVGFDGPVIDDFREHEVPNALVRFTDPGLGDPHNEENVGYDIAYVVQDAALGPKQVLRFTNVDLADVASAKLAFSSWINFDVNGATSLASYAFRARLNGNAWLERTLNAQEVALLRDGPTTIDASGAPIGDPASQGRLAFVLDVPLADLRAGDNTVEFVTVNVPTSYPPLVLNIDLILRTNG